MYLKKETFLSEQWGVPYIPALDVMLDGQQSPLMNAVTRTTASLVKCFEGSQRKILYPQMAGN